MSQSLIFSRSATDGILSASQIVRRAPSVFTEYDHAEGLSSRYGEISTLQAMQVLADYGWQPVQALQRKPRIKGAAIYSAHMMAFSNPNMSEIDGEGRPEVVLYNSHDGTSSLKLFAGFYRFICSNGIIAGSGFANSVRHTAKNSLSFEAMIADTIERVPELLATVECLKQTRIHYSEARTMAIKSASLRWDDLQAVGYGGEPIKSGVYFDSQTLSKILQPVRFEDSHSDAWTIFNRIQESVTRGKTLVASVTRDNDDQVSFKYRNARALGAVSELVRVNRGLWDIVRDTVEV